MKSNSIEKIIFGMGTHTTRDQRVQIKTLAAQGWTHERIAAYTHKPRSTVSRVIRQPLTTKEVSNFIINDNVNN